MANYKCFKCGKSSSNTILEKATTFKCQHCGCKIFYKPRTKIRKIKAV